MARALDGAPPPPRAVARTDGATSAFAESLHELDRRVGRLEHQAAPAVPASPAVAAEPEARAPASPVRSAPQTSPAARILEGLTGHTFGHADSETLFRRLAETPPAIDATIEDLKARLARDPQSADLHCALATAYGAKTAFGVVGAARGETWALAEAEYDAAIRLDPNHWEARYGKAFGASMAPEFVGLRPEAIRQFEELMEIQESQAPAEDHVLVYARLGTLYKDAGNVARAREVWQRGAKRFPDDARLKDMLSLAEER